MDSGLTPAEALRRILAATPMLPAQTLPVGEAQGRVLALPVVSTRDLPPADNSAMDGYAVKRNDLTGASSASPVVLPVVREIAAGGAADHPLEAGNTGSCQVTESFVKEPATRQVASRPPS